MAKPINPASLSFSEQLGDTSVYFSDITPFKWQHIVSLVTVFIWFAIGRWLYDYYYRFLRRTTAFTLADELTQRDNKASAIDFAAFLWSIGIVTVGSLTDLPVEPAKLGRYFYTFFIYQFIGILLMVVARALVDRFVLRGIDNVSAIVDDQNMGVAIVEASATIASAIVIAAAAAGYDPDFGAGVGATFIYWLIGQTILIGYVFVLNFVSARLPTSPSLQPSIEMTSTSAPDEPTEAAVRASRSVLQQVKEGNNVAAGLSLGFDLVIAALLIRSGITTGYSIVALVIWCSVTLVVVMPMMHLYMDNLILTGVSYHDNVMRSKNWGAAAFLGTLKLLTAFVLAAMFKENCSLDSMDLSTGYCDQPLFDRLSLWEKMVHVAIPSIFSWQSLVNLFVLLLLMGIAKSLFYLRFVFRDGPGKAKDHFRDFSLDKQLADTNNNAVAISLAGFCFATGMTLVGVMDCPSDNVGVHAAFLIAWTCIGCVLVLVSMLINDRVLLRGINNAQALLEDNVAVACMEAGSFVACGIIMKATLSGGGQSFEEGLTLTVIYWAVTQLLLMAFTAFYRLITVYDDLKYITERNYAAGVSSGIYLIALSVVIAFPIYKYVSLAVFFPVAITAGIILIVFRMIVDKLLLPGDKIDDEIGQNNWGASFIEGASAVSLAFILTVYIPGDYGGCDL